MYLTLRAEEEERVMNEARATQGIADEALRRAIGMGHPSLTGHSGSET